ncbi:thioredoxin domain-containing protein [Kangiella taiwanensis]|uniref:Thioredoxin domain-containing protein n=1 Tax=Kangiella taiwanensis TaxID=1079179 RepID=A0ABP8HW32_9GAMM|nr:thioredoxin domain-containing protein [Kangiella taiwanensis]
MQNTLKAASSPYLQQHKDNPVHWQQWSDDVLALAKEQDKPILLSVGYSSCHWCHVMAHESFEDPDVATVMNDLFINIKLDREERPDLDKTYQLAHQLLNRQAGGWPLTAVLDPQTLVPFFSGTYFPKEAKFGLPAFTELLQKISEVFNEQRQEIHEQNGRLSQALQVVAGGSEQDGGSSSELVSLTSVLASNIIERADSRHGGMEGAPKFPQPAIWSAALHLAQSEWLEKEQAQGITEAINQSLKGFRQYGLFDHLGGGFFRYCVDERWEIPHFEKMLYDNGQLLSLLSEAGQHYADGDIMQAVDLTIRWLEEQMLSPEGGFYSALDADSEDDQGRSREGAYYCWQLQQLEFLNEDEQRFAKAYYGLNQSANFEGKWHLVTRQSWREVAKDLNVHEKQSPILMESARQQMKMVRDKRLLPFRDDKLLTSWNALTVQGLLQAKKAGSKAVTDELIEGCIEFLRRKVWSEQQLWACFKDGKHYQPAFLDDYGYLAKALLLSLSDQFSQQNWVWLTQIIDILWHEFADQANGGFYFTSEQQETVITRHKSWSDDAMPSSTTQALEALWVVAELTNDTEKLSFVENSLHSAAAQAKQSPLQHPSVIRLLDIWQKGLELWVLRGESFELPSWHEYLATGLNPGRWVFALEKGINDVALEKKFPAKADMAAYCCREHQCYPPIESFEQLKEFVGTHAI